MPRRTKFKVVDFSPATIRFLAYAQYAIHKGFSWNISEYLGDNCDEQECKEIDADLARINKEWEDEHSDACR